ncbi:MAG: GNAT family N-acetyltransferase [Gemmatimonadales bacterium]
MDLRVATLADIPELARVINAAYRAEDFFINGDRTNAADLAQRIEGESGGFFVLDDPQRADVLLGAVYVELRGTRGYFGMLSVDPARHGEGIARMLIEGTERYCAANGCEAMELDVVNLREELPGFYSRFGYTVGEEYPFPDPAKLSRPAHLVRWSKALGKDT